MLLNRLYFTNDVVRKLQVVNSVVTKKNTGEMSDYITLKHTLEELSFNNVSSPPGFGTGPFNISFFEHLNRITIQNSNFTILTVSQVTSTLDYIELTDVTLECKPCDLYFNREKGKNYTLTWKVWSSTIEAYFYPRIFGSPDYNISFVTAKFLSGPDYFWKETTARAGFISKLCIPQTVSRIEFGSLANETDLLVGELCVCGAEKCDESHIFTNESEQFWLTRNCTQFSEAICAICFMHQTGLHREKDKVDQICKGEVDITTPIRHCYWQPFGYIPPKITTLNWPVAALFEDQKALVHARCLPKDIRLPQSESVILIRRRN